MSGNVFRLTVEAAGNGMRLDQYIAQAVPSLSRTAARRIIDLGGVHHNGRRVRRSSQALAADDKLEIFLDDRQEEDFSLAQEHILFRDPYLLVLDKPPGVATQPTPSRYKGTLYEALLRMLGASSGSGRKPSLGMVQRLDRDTSGVMVFSIHPRAHKSMSAAFAAHRVQKFYLALVSGAMPCRQGEFRSQLARQRRTNLMKTVEKGGKEALTRYRVVDSFGSADLVEVEIPTGRSHQIRVHFAEAGHPLLGDTRYGGPSEWLGQRVSRQMLHAWKLRFEHPVSGQALDFEAPLPEDLSKLLESGRNR